MNKKPAIVLAVILAAAGASAFTASNRLTEFLYLPNGAGPGEYEHVQLEVNCPKTTTTGCVEVINTAQGPKQLYTTVNNITVPLTRQ